MCFHFHQKSLPSGFLFLFEYIYWGFFVHLDLDLWRLFLNFFFVFDGLGGRLVYQYTKKRASGPKCPVTGKKIQGVCAANPTVSFHQFSP